MFEYKQKKIADIDPGNCWDRIRQTVVWAFRLISKGRSRSGKSQLNLKNLHGTGTALLLKSKPAQVGERQGPYFPKENSCCPQVYISECGGGGNGALLISVIFF